MLRGRKISVDNNAFSVLDLRLKHFRVRFSRELIEFGGSFGF